MNLDASCYLDEIFSESVRAKTHFFTENKEKLITVAEHMASCIKAGGKIIVAGNGGSASDACHFAGELTGRLLKERPGLPCIVLGSGMASLTAIGNDYGYPFVFVRELKAFVKKEDFMIFISTSGNSENVVLAAQYAKFYFPENTLALTGGDGGRLKNYVKHLLNVEKGSNSSRIQETHIFILHALVDLMDRFFLSFE